MFLMGSISPLVSAFLQHPLPEREKREFRESIQTQKLAQLARWLEEDIHDQKKRLIIEEIGSRNVPDALAVLAQFIKNTTALQKTDKKSPTNDMLLGTALVESARLKSKGSHDSFLTQLEQLLSDKNSHIQTAAALEIGKIGSAQARNLLLKYEDTYPMIKIERLRLDYWNLNDEDFVRAIFKSAQELILKGNNHLVAERSIISSRTGLSPAWIEQEMKNPSIASEVYTEFLEDVHKQANRQIAMQYPGWSDILKLYINRDERASSELQKAYLDETIHWEYREKAYEWFLTLKLEQSELTKEEWIKQLLSDLKTLGDGSSSEDWQNEAKTLQAIKDAVIVKKLIQYGKATGPFIDQKLKEISPDESPRQVEALLHIKNRASK